MNPCEHIDASLNTASQAECFEIFDCKVSFFLRIEHGQGVKWRDSNG